MKIFFQHNWHLDTLFRVARPVGKFSKVFEKYYFDKNAYFLPNFITDRDYQPYWSFFKAPKKKLIICIFYENITEFWNRNDKFLFFIYLGSGTSKSCSKTFCYAFWLHGEAEYEGPAYGKWLKNKGLFYPVDDNGEFLQTDQVQELMINKAEIGKNWAKCKVTDIVYQSSKFWNPNSRPTGS